MCFSSLVLQARNQSFCWQDRDRTTLKRINILIEAGERESFAGIEKSEPLLANLSGYWSRRIDEANRLVYRATDDELVVIECRYHYDS
jgi:toxin YoeB